MNEKCWLNNYIRSAHTASKISFYMYPNTLYFESQPTALSLGYLCRPTESLVYNKALFHIMCENINEAVGSFSDLIAYAFFFNDVYMLEW